MQLRQATGKKRQTDLGVEEDARKIVTCTFTLILGPSILLGRSAKKLECDKGKLNEKLDRIMSIIRRSDE